jgi:hypothetical protein
MLLGDPQFQGLHDELFKMHEITSFAKLLLCIRNVSKKVWTMKIPRGVKQFLFPVITYKPTVKGK